MSKTYILQKDLPDGSRVGDKYIKGEYRYYNERIHAEAKGIIESVNWETWQVEDNPEWFLPEENKSNDSFQEFTKDFDKVPLGLYEIFWEGENGSSLAAVGNLHDGDRWIAPINWTAQECPTGRMSNNKMSIDKMVLIQELGGKRLHKNDSFQWTDELVLMGLDRAHHNGYHKFKQTCKELFDEIKWQAQHGGYKFSQWVTDHVKQSNTPKPQAENKPDWEIAEYGHKDARFAYTEKKVFAEWRENFQNPSWWLQKPDFYIRSVKRLSDGEVFSVGDEVETGNDAVVRDWSGKITEFWICGSYSESMHVFYNGNHCDLKYLKKKLPPQPQKEEPLFGDRPIFTPRQVEQMCEDAFNAAREVFEEQVTGRIEYINGDWSLHHPPKYMNFKDYKQSKQ